MPDDLTDWVWILTCGRCMSVIDFNDVCVPTQRLREWATCCGQIMELETVLRRRTDA